MKKILLLGLALALTGCYGYTTMHTLKPTGKECSYYVEQWGNSVVGYSETTFTNEEKAEKECKEWLQK